MYPGYIKDNFNILGYYKITIEYSVFLVLDNFLGYILGVDHALK